MIDSTPLRAVVDESPAGSAQLIVEADVGRHAENTLKDVLPESRQGAGSMTFQCKDIRVLWADPDVATVLLTRTGTRSRRVFRRG